MKLKKSKIYIDIIQCARYTITGPKRPERKNKMRRNEVTAEALKRMGYVAKCSFTSWNGHEERLCNDRQSAELFNLVVNTVQMGEKIDIRRNHVRGTVVVWIDEATTSYRGAELRYYLERKMTDAEVMEASARSGLWVSNPA